MKNYIPFFTLLAIILLISFATYNLAKKQDQLNKEQNNYSFTKSKIKLKDFTLNNLIENKISLSNSDLEDKLVIINFFASWCSTCISEHNILMQLKSDNFVEIYGVAWRDINKNTKSFINKLGNPFNEIFTDPKNILGKIANISAVPESLIVKNNKIIFRYRGSLQEPHILEIRSIIKSLK